MRKRRWIGILAVLGVLLHAGALVHHSAGMLGATLAHHALVSDLVQICHPGGATQAVPRSDLPYIPKPSDAQSCPLCSGLGHAFALPAPQPAAIVLPQAAASVFDRSPLPVLQPTHAVCPPARGPPALA